MMRISRIALAACLASGLGFGVAGGGVVPAYGEPACDPAAVEAAIAEIAATCPCDGKTAPSGEVIPWKNHGQYVSCVARTRNQVAKDLELSKSCLRRVTPCGARSTCGKPGFVTCRIPDLCSDPLADGIPAGTCTDDPTIACDTAADCPVLRCSVKSSTEACDDRGGISGTGSCCD